MRSNTAICAVVMFLALTLVSPLTDVEGAYKKCSTPTASGFGTNPNVMIVMDYSGSMMWSAYYGSGDTSANYDSMITYYGLFDSDTYYNYVDEDPNDDNEDNSHYFVPSGNPPVKWKGFAGPTSAGTNGGIVVNVTNHGYLAGDIIAFKGMTTHSEMNADKGGSGYKIEEVIDADHFRVKFTRNQSSEGLEEIVFRSPDDTSGQCIKRVKGNVLTVILSANEDAASLPVSGLSGNILNLITTARVDSALKALIGGKAECDDPYDTDSASTDGEYCYLQSQRQGCDVTISDLALHAKMKQGTLTSRNYSDSPYPGRDLFLTLEAGTGGAWTGTLMPTSMGGCTTRRNYQEHRIAELYHFEVPAGRQANASITLGGTAQSGAYWYLFKTSTNDPDTIDGNNYYTYAGTTGTTASKTVYNLPAGHYWLDVNHHYNLTTPETTPTPYWLQVAVKDAWSGADITFEKADCACKNTLCYTGPPDDPDHCKCHWGTAPEPFSLGGLIDARVRVRTPKSTRNSAIIQTNYEDVRFGFTYYRGTEAHILVGCGSAANQEKKLINSMSGYYKDTDSLTVYQNKYVYPSGNTPTQTGVEEAWKYFTRESSTLSNGWQYGGNWTTDLNNDPYYDDGVWQWCRKSYVLLVTDGAWNSGLFYPSYDTRNDPLPYVTKLRRSTDGSGDIRPDLLNYPANNGQNVKTYTIYAFDPTGDGDNAMKWMGMYGGFKEDTSCGANLWPYPKTDYNFNSYEKTFEVTECPAGHTDGCCNEWDTDSDGLPDAYYKVNNGYELKDALTEALSNIRQTTAAASAVALSSGGLTSGSTVVRAYYEVEDSTKITEPDEDPVYVWFGHLELYWPFDCPEDLQSFCGGEQIYDFYPEYNPDSDPCWELKNTGHCWDAAQIMKGDLHEVRGGSADFYRDWPGLYSANNKGRYVFTWGRDDTKYYKHRRPFVDEQGKNATLGPLYAERMTADELGIPTTRTKCEWVEDETQPEGSGIMIYQCTEIAYEDDLREKEADLLVRWVRGDDAAVSLDEIGTLYRYRNHFSESTEDVWAIGDIVYSTPLIVGPPALGAVSKRFIDYTADGVEVNTSDYLNWRADKVCTGATLNEPCPDPLDTQDKTCGLINTRPDDPCVAYRDKVVYVGANDGMLHAFLMAVALRVGGTDDSPDVKWIYDPNANLAEILSSAEYTFAITGKDGVPGWNDTHGDPASRIPYIGKELWAYIPSNLLTELRDTALTTYGTTAGCKHRTLLDLSPKSYEVFFHSDNRWHTVLIGGERGGGDMFFAIDVTNPHDPRPMWEYSVLKDMVLTLDTSKALDKFKAKCTDTTYTLAPGQEYGVDQCSSPLIDADWFNASTVSDRCGGCTQSDGECLSLLNSKWGGKFYMPFGEDPAVDPSDPNPPAAPTLTMPNLNYMEAKNTVLSWASPMVARVLWPVSYTKWRPKLGTESEATARQRHLFAQTDLKMSVCVADPDPGGTGACTFESKCDRNTPDDCVDYLVGKYPARHVAFIPVGPRAFEDSRAVFNENYPDFLVAGFKDQMVKPMMLALDIETGANLFRYLWPHIHETAKKYTSLDIFKPRKGGCYNQTPPSGSSNSTLECPGLRDVNVPYAGAAATPVDVLSAKYIETDASVIVEPGEDDFADYVYWGDLNGVFYGLKLNFLAQENSGEANKEVHGVKLDMWYSKPIYNGATDTATLSTNQFRSDRQPITARPAISYELDTDYLRIIFGSGKWEEHSEDGASDRSDTSRGSIYNLRDPVEAVAINSGSDWAGSYGSGLKAFNFELRPRCVNEALAPLKPELYYPNYRCQHPDDQTDTCKDTITDSLGDQQVVYGCRWRKPETIGAGEDCCRSDCADDLCWRCVFDLVIDGERITEKAVIAGELTFLTSFRPRPATDCNTDAEGFLYIFDYMCRPFAEDFDPAQKLEELGFRILRFKTEDTVNRLFGERISLGAGIPSAPVLDPEGENVIIQTGEGKVLKLPVELRTKRATVKGWLEKHE